MMNPILKRISFFILLLFFIHGTTVLAVDTSDPMSMMKTIANNMLNALKENRPNLKRNPKLVFNLVYKHLLPHVDVAGMSRSAIGRNAWTKATSQQQQAFNKAFTDIVIQTYASALNAYTDESIKFFPLREDISGKKRVLIQSQIIRQDGPPVPLDYRLAWISNRWKIYDLNVEGVSLLQSFHAQFASELSQGKTLSTLTIELQNKVKK
ncbi:MAG: ABC transporter substrate-binding protein [Gammaproteobacteria bacterium]|nr:ABC transporter substrate-binding protein [Gammaproteobacteria bacterium]